jgi:hypothetical protein
LKAKFSLLVNIEDEVSFDLCQVMSHGWITWQKNDNTLSSTARLEQIKDLALTTLKNKIKQ